MFLEESTKSGGQKDGGVFLVFLLFGCKLQPFRLNDTLITDVCALVGGLDEAPGKLLGLLAESAALFFGHVNYFHGFVPRPF